MASEYTTIDKTKLVATIQPAAISATTTGVTVDTLGYDSVGVMLHVGVVTTADDENYFTIAWEHGDASNMSDAADAADYLTKVQGGTMPTKVALTTGDEVTYTAHYFGSKRYIRCKITETGTAVGDFCAFVQLAVPGIAPVS